MSKVEALLLEINNLSAQEFQLLVTKLLAKANKLEQATNMLSKYRGIGKGVWPMDAQEYVNELRNDQHREF